MTDLVRVPLGEGRALIQECLKATGHSQADAEVFADQVMDIELRGSHFGGFSRALSICSLVIEKGAVQPISVVRETPVSILLDGGDQLGYVVAHRATQTAIAKARQNGVGLGGAHNTWYTGQFAYYMEMATREGLVAFATGAAAPFVAPAGATEGRLGTNPISFGFPTDGDPVIVDIGTSEVMVGDLVLWDRTGKKVPEGLAYDREGKPTTNPAEALQGAIAAWGGHKGSGLSMAVQLLGIMCQAEALPPKYKDCSYFICVIDPAIFTDPAEFRRTASAYAETISSARALDPAKPPRVPFARSAAERRQHLANGYIDVPANIHAQLVALSQRKHAKAAP